jgi:hypothetical protein
METERKSIVVASLWMVVLSLALFFLPLVNGLLGGLVGGYFAGSWRRGLLAALVPAAIVAAGTWWLLAAFDAPVMGLGAGVAIGVLVAFADVGLFLGAAVGGVLAETRQRSANFAR